MTYDFAVFIGRFQPLHIGHQHVIDGALSQAQTVILLIGSSDAARSIRNPFTFDERRHMLELVYRHEIATGRIVIVPINDRAYNDAAWIAQVQQAVDETILELGNRGPVRLNGTADFKVALAGYGKDGSSYYLNLFPQWESINVQAQFGTLNSTEIRGALFQRLPNIPTFGMSPAVLDWLRSFVVTEEFSRLVGEREYIDAYRASWKGAPYPPVFVTADAIALQSGHVLLVRRGQHPGKGLLAIPGGFLDQRETLRAAAVRELKEETRIADHKGELPPAMLESFIDDKATRVFDAPNRSARGRVVTHAFLFRCPDRRKLFRVRGDDDAAAAGWHRLGELTPSQFFEDHFAVLEEMIGL